MTGDMIPTRHFRSVEVYARYPVTPTAHTLNLIPHRITNAPRIHPRRDLEVYGGPHCDRFIAISRTNGNKALLVYEYFLTLTKEVERFWGLQRITWPTFFFYLNRYLTLFGHVPVMVEYFWYPMVDSKRETLIRIHRAFFLIDVVQVWISTVVLLIMRMYALYDRSKKVLSLYLCMALGVAILACWAIFTGKKKHPSREYSLPMGCTGLLSQYAANRLAIAWGGMLVFDIVIFLMTLYKSLLLRKISGMNILNLILRDGKYSLCIFAKAAEILDRIDIFRSYDCLQPRKYFDLSNLAVYISKPRVQLFTRGVGTTFTNVSWHTTSINGFVFDMQVLPTSMDIRFTKHEEMSGSKARGYPDGASIFRISVRFSGQDIPFRLRASVDADFNFIGYSDRAIQLRVYED
ncbi:hypothetical protein BDZ94DRAFT_1299507 [Collybia nuda]|uniref:DUF6533 domain-containing protein n=1 Tax=Collybia nuda TaxID=64659 RepID=A0A9P5Y4G7_9AGAR|nr:hypothetical protein BDZ94DRAFT_1299507 [Collybia nuda]